MGGRAGSGCVSGPPVDCSGAACADGSDGATSRMSGRAPDNRLVHFAADFTRVDGAVPRPGDMVEVEVTYGAPHHLVADGPVLAVRRTRAGDAWERRTAEPAAPKGVALGMPTVGRPEPLPPVVDACSVR